MIWVELLVQVLKNVAAQITNLISDPVSNFEIKSRLLYLIGMKNFEPQQKISDLLFRN